MAEDHLAEELSRRRVAKGENRLPPAAAVVVALVVYALLPESVLFAPRLVIPVVEAACSSRWSSQPAPGDPGEQVVRGRVGDVAGVVVVANLVSLGLLISCSGKSRHSAGGLLVAAMQVWVTNVIGFALVFWELDRGGPVVRRTVRRDKLPPADWRFSQDENDDAVIEVAVGASAKSGWIPTFIDYLYLS